MRTGSPITYLNDLKERISLDIINKKAPNENESHKGLFHDKH